MIPPLQTKLAKMLVRRFREIGLPQAFDNPQVMKRFFFDNGVLIWRSKPANGLPRAAVAMPMPFILANPPTCLKSHRITDTAEPL